VRRRALTREAALKTELERESRPARRRKKNRGQKRQRAVPQEKREARKAYLELSNTLDWLGRQLGETEEQNSDGSERPVLQIPGAGQRRKRKHSKTQHIRA